MSKRAFATSLAAGCGVAVAARRRLPCWAAPAAFALALLAAAGPAFGQSVKLPAELHGAPGIPLPVVAEADGANVVWLTPDPGLVVIDGGFFKGDSKRALLFGPAGRYRLWALTAKGDTVSPRAESLVTIGDAPPGPTPPGPTPPGPTPPGPAPLQGAKALLIYESDALTTMPPAQQAALYSKAVRDYLNAHTDLGPDGKTHEWRMWDKDVDPSGEAPVWRDALKRPRQSVPWLIVSGPGGGYEGPCPPNVAEMLATLKKCLEK